LAGLRQNLTSVTSPATLDGVRESMGAAAKKAALEAAADDLGGDRAMSGLRRRSADLRAGYDLAPDTTLNLYPKGLWVLADKGRRDVDRVYPRGKRSGRQVKGQKKALKTPWGPRAWVSGSQWGGLRTIRDVETRLPIVVPKAAAEALATHIERTF
jgi:hypothetical protein